MSRRNLHVSFEEKDEAKLLGARWDASARCWYVPDGCDESLFSKWFEPSANLQRTPPDYSGIELNLRISKPVIAESIIACWSCRGKTPVLTVAGRDANGDLESITGIKAFEAQLGAELGSRPHYKMMYSGTTRMWAYANVCISCGALQGDFFLHNEPDGPFFALHAPDNPSKLTDLAVPVRVATDHEPYQDVGYQ